jgi:hypothetical protein
MSKNELLRLYKASIAEKADLNKEIGWYSCFSQQDVGEILILFTTNTRVLGKIKKKYKRAKKALDVNNEPLLREIIAYPIGKTPGRGDFNLADYIFEKSGVGKETYNIFVVRVSPPLQSCHIKTSSPDRGRHQFMRR